jgi:hypothetical protein
MNHVKKSLSLRYSISHLSSQPQFEIPHFVQLEKYLSVLKMQALLQTRWDHTKIFDGSRHLISFK